MSYYNSKVFTSENIAETPYPKNVNNLSPNTFNSFPEFSYTAKYFI